MSIVKSLAVGLGDMFYIVHNSDSFTIIDCDLDDDNAESILRELKKAASGKTVTRFICTHPDDDHFGGIHLLDDEMPIRNFYTIKNNATKAQITESFQRYCDLRDSEKAFYLFKGCTRRWLNLSDETRGGAGIHILWPDTSNRFFREALQSCNAGVSFNNTSVVMRYVTGRTSFLWLGDLETEFMESIEDSIDLEKTTIVFAAHHGRTSGKIPNSWLEKLDPQIIVIGEAPSRHLSYYTNYKTITQNKAGDITMVCSDDKVHFYVSNEDYSHDELVDEGQSEFPNYIGSITVETEYTL